MSRLLIKDVIVGGVSSSIYVKDGIIAKILRQEDIVPECDETVDGKGGTAISGFINMHTHAAMSLMRGIEEDIPLGDWLAKIWEKESKIDSDFVYYGTKIACIEMIRTGTTTFNDQYWFSPAARQAAVETGIRPVVSYVALDRNQASETERQKEQCTAIYERMQGLKDGGLFAMAFHAIYSVSEELMLWSADFARKHSLKLHIHLSETRKEVEDCKQAHGGLTPFEYLDRLGILGPDTIAAHTLHLSPVDIEILGHRRVNCVHNINSNTKLASGYMFKYNELRDAGANVCLGTDGCASSNNLDMLETMKTSALIQKAWREDAGALPINELFRTATVNGAKALGLDTGEIAEGKIADIAIVDTDSTFFLSPGKFLSNLIYSAHSDCIRTLIAGGKVVMRDRIVPGEQEAMEKAKVQLDKIR